jgi:hypothetical protein
MVITMNKMVGNKLFVLLMFLLPLFSLCVDIKLEIKNGEGVATNHLVAGQPFFIETVIHGIQGSAKAPDITGIDTFNPRSSGMYMSTINGVSTTKYTYQAVAHKTGSYSIGPAHFVHKQTEYVSSPVTIVVQDEGDAQKNKKSSQSKELPAFLRLVVDTPQAVVGQKIKASLRFYYQDPTTILSAITQPDHKDVVIKNMSNVVGGTIEIDDVHYRYAEWTWDMYPTQAGELTIPFYTADYEVPGTNNGMFGGIFMMMGGRQKKRLYSNTVKIAVDPLPSTTSEVNAIGIFTEISASISPARVKEGEGMILTIDVVGKNNVEEADIKTVVMPSQLRCYPSQTQIIPADAGDDTYKKRFEFIVQGMKPGEWEIPEQQFVFFDTNKHEYGILRTAQLSVCIDAGENRQVDILPDVPEKTVTVEKNQHNKKHSPLCIMIDYRKEKEPLGLLWLLLLMILPLVCLYYDQLFLFFSSLFINRFIGRQKHALHLAKRRIKRISAENKPELLYYVFVELFSTLVDKPIVDISPLSMHEYMNVHSEIENDRAQWRMFLDELLSMTYSGCAKKNSYELYRMSLEWIDYIKRCI